MAFAKLKAFLRKVAARSIPELWDAVSLAIGRVFELSWLKPDRSSYTVACNLPVQGACADAAMLALAAIDDALSEEGIGGGPVAWLHDEIVLEVQ